MIDNFRGDYFFLSNFYPCPFLFAGMEWPSVEHAYQAWKSREWIIREQIRKLPDAARARRAGRSLARRRDWNKIKQPLMLALLRSKFGQSKELVGKLLATGDQELVEGNTWCCNEWGSCRCPKCVDKPKLNMLGLMLIQVRGELKIFFTD